MEFNTHPESTGEPISFEDPLNDYEPARYGSSLEEALAEVPVGQINARPFVAVSPTTTIREAVQALYGSGNSVVLVVEEGKLVGVFTERDVLDQVAERFLTVSHLPVRDVMTSDPTVVYESDPSGTAVAAIAVAGHRLVPVLDIDDYLVGVVGPQRVFRFMEEFSDEASEEN